MTSRFSAETIYQNAHYREQVKKGCIYCSPTPISQNIPDGSVLFVIELNITENRVEGIGMIKKKIPHNYIPVYENGNYNRFVYMGDYRISRNEMRDKEEQIMQFFDIICFRGKFHMKRGGGITQFPRIVEDRCKKVEDLLAFIKNMFKIRYGRAPPNKT
jgi:hypothetical protein